MRWSGRRPPNGDPAEVVRRGGQKGLPSAEIDSSGGAVLSPVSALPLTDRAADAALVYGLSTGDDVAAVTFVRRFQSAVFGLALAVTRDLGMAEDVSQEAFLRAWRSAATYDVRKGSVATWLLTITRNVAIDSIRSRRPTPVGDEALDELLLGTLGTEQEEAMATRLESDRITARLRDLPPEQARAVVLAVLAGCTAAEVSAREGIPLGTAKTRLRLGLTKLRDALAEPRAGDDRR